MHPFLMLLAVPCAAAALAYVLPRLRNELTFAGAVVSLYYAVRVFVQSRHGIVSLSLLNPGEFRLMLQADALSGFILLFVGLFGVLVLGYSLRYMRGTDGVRGYYLYMPLLMATANGALLSGTLPVLLFFWGSMMAVLYGLLLVGRPGRDRVAARTLLLVGLSDFSLLLGIALLLAGGASHDLAPAVPMGLAEPRVIAAFLLMTLGALAKAGSMPLHSWIPEAAGTAPATVMAFVPGALDKLLGIYLLIRLSVYMFSLASNTTLRLALMAVGAVTVLGAVLMALVQKRVTRLLAFHAVSQVGYMVLGIGTGVPVGIAGGLFHMLNHSIYKSALFLSAGSVGRSARTDDVDELGGLAGRMPLTFASFLVAALAIAGVPPLNGFVSKWMVYQGLIEFGREGNAAFVVFLVAAMAGSVLTLASFVKLLHSVFFGQRQARLDAVKEVGFTMWLPTALLAAACIALGVFAWPLALRPLIFPALPLRVEMPGIWQPLMATLLMLLSLGLGVIVYLMGTMRVPVAGRNYVGGEKVAESEQGRVSGSAFYGSVKHLPILSDLLRFGEVGALDVYRWLRGVFAGASALFGALHASVLEALYSAFGRLVRGVGGAFSGIQNGFLPLYVAWVFIGAVVFYLVMALR